VKVYGGRLIPREAANKESSPPAPETGVDVDADELTRLRQEVGELQEENAALRKELARLRAVAG
jgi:uncharacterized small protein (DUF1192 family)